MHRVASHYITLRYVTLSYVTSHRVTSRNVTSRHVTLRYITLHYITLHYITLHYITLHYITLHYITLHYITLHYITLHYITLHYITLHYITLHYITLHYITLHYITLHYITLHYITLHYITLQNIAQYGPESTAEVCCGLGHLHLEGILDRGNHTLNILIFPTLLHLFHKHPLSSSFLIILLLLNPRGFPNISGSQNGIKYRSSTLSFHLVFCFILRLFTGAPNILLSTCSSSFSWHVRTTLTFSL